MSLYESLLTIHILAAGLWLGSGIAIGAMTRRALAQPEDAGPLLGNATWWAGRAHPAAGFVLLLTGPAMVAELDLEFSELWITLATVGLVALFAIGGGLTGRTAQRLVARGELSSAEAQGDARSLLRYMTIETVVLVLIIADMVIKPT